MAVSPKRLKTIGFEIMTARFAFEPRHARASMPKMAVKLAPILIWYSCRRDGKRTITRRMARLYSDNGLNGQALSESIAPRILLSRFSVCCGKLRASVKGTKFFGEPRDSSGMLKPGG